MPTARPVEPAIFRDLLRIGRIRCYGARRQPPARNMRAGEFTDEGKETRMTHLL